MTLTSIKHQQNLILLIISDIQHKKTKHIGKN